MKERDEVKDPIEHNERIHGIELAEAIEGRVIQVSFSDGHVSFHEDVKVIQHHGNLEVTLVSEMDWK